MYLGIDLGTSELKALLLDSDHGVIAQTGGKLGVSRPQPLWSEQNPEDWMAALFAALDQLAATAPKALRAVRAIGLSGQMHGAVLLDAANAVLRPAILWNDGRSHEECAALEAAVPDLRRITGNLVMPGFTAPKLLWVRRHEPEVFRRIRRVLLPKDYLRLVLSGEAATDCSDASGTAWFDVSRRAWSETLLAACGLGLDSMPRAVEGNARTGTLRRELAARWGMREDVIVAAGGGDNAASAVGIGAVSPGDGFVSLGTSGVIFVVSNAFHPNPANAVHAFCHALPERWHQMSVMLAAASCLAWVSTITGSAIETELLPAIGRLGDAERDAAPLFLPYLSGERTPHNDPSARAAFLGLAHGHGAAELAYAVMEGVGFGLRDGLAALQATGPAIDALVLVGGGARSPFWCQLLADQFGVPLTLAEGGATGAALGAARLAWLADGGTIAEVCTKPPELRHFAPDAARRARLEARYIRFRRAYDASAHA
ncbi:MAG: xylulokinase [Acidiphilium sp.]